MQKTFFIKTLGCKVNQYETQAMREALAASGLREVTEPHEAGYIIVNSCTVTQHSDRKTFYYMRRFKKANPDATMILIGCTVEDQTAEKLYAKGADIILTNADKRNIVRAIARKDSDKSWNDISPHRSSGSFAISHFTGHSRAFVKIQDGCNMNCSYCKVRLVRGPSRSRHIEDIVDEIKRLADNGYKEIVFAGVQLGAFGRDLNPGSNLISLLADVTALSAITRIRLSSIEPFDVSSELIDFIRHNKKICPHFHLPLQSGDNVVLKRMRRTYTRKKYFDLIERLRSDVEGFTFTTDVIVGFPGEDERAFSNTVELLRTTKPFKSHIFPFSAREGTDAYAFAQTVDGLSIKRRECVLQELNDMLFYELAGPLVGTQQDVLIETIAEAQHTAKGRMRDYREVLLKDCQCKGNEDIRVRITDRKKGYLVGVPL